MPTCAPCFFLECPSFQYSITRDDIFCLRLISTFLFVLVLLQVVTRIRTSGSNCLLLLADRECDAWHREQGIVIRSDLPYTIISDSRQEEEEELDLRLQKLVMEEQEEVDSPVYLSRQESSTASDISTASENSTRSSNSLSPGPDQVNNLSQHPSCLTEIRAKVADVLRPCPCMHKSDKQ